MTSIPYRLLSSLAAAGLILAAGAAVAQTPDDTGIVHITDKVAGTSAAAAWQNCPHGGGVACPPASAGDWIYGRPCPHGCHPHRCTHHVHAILDWFNPHGAGTHSPDHGYSPPTKLRTYRRGVAYQKFFPDAWMGVAPAAVPADLPRPPVVYMPTDTTQLGYYYQHVPRWWPVPGMIPPAPRPAQWHVPVCNNLAGPVCPEPTIIEAQPQEGTPGNVIEPLPDAQPVPTEPPPPPPESAGS